MKPNATNVVNPKNRPALVDKSYISDGSRWSSSAVACVLVCFTVFVYLPVTSFEFLKLDDDSYVTANLMVQRGLSPLTLGQLMSNTLAGNWHPVTVLSHMLDCSIFGISAGPHHLVNVGLHVLNLILLVALVCVWTGKYLPAILVGALFALHPLRVESVAWISERKDVLSSAFWLVGLGIYGSWVKRRHWAKFVLLALSLTLGLLSKAMLVTFPFTLLLLDIWPLRRVELSRRFLVDREFWRGLWPLFREKLPLFAITATFCWVALYAQRSAGAVADLEILSLTVRIQTALVAYVSYLDKFFRPVNLACMYPHPGFWPWGLVLGSGLILLLITGLTLVMARTRPWWFFGWFWYLGTLVPVIGLVQIGDQWMADRYTYIPLIGPVFALVWEFDSFVRRGKGGLIIGISGIIGVLGLCFFLTSRQLMTWKDTETLSRHAIKVAGGNPAIWTNLAICHAEKGRLEDALRGFGHVAKCKPRDPDAFNNVGRVLEQMARFDDARGYYLAAINLDPDHILARQNLGRLFVIIGRDDLAIQQFEALLRLQPDNPTGYFQLARILATSQTKELRNQGKALSLAERGCHLEPSPTSSGREILAAAYAGVGQVAESVRALSDAADLARDAGQSNREKKLRERLMNLRQALR